MQRTAVAWVIFAMTHSALMLGVSVFVGQIPSSILSVFGGVFSDRYDRYKVLLVTQIASLVQALLLALLILWGKATVWEILSLSAVLGVINAFDVPARQSLVYQMVDKKEDLPNAIALNSSMVNLARVVGPMVSGIVLQKFGAGVCFLANAGSFVAVITSLMMMRLAKYDRAPDTKKIMTELTEGFQYLRRTPSIGYVILMLAFVSLLVLPFNTLLPVYAKVIFKGNATTFGLLNSAIGLGAILGFLFLASLKPGRDLKIILMINTVIFGIGLILFSHAINFYLSLLFAIISGFGMMSQTTISNTIIQTSVQPDMRGRVISYFAMAFFGMMPVGGLLVGWVSEHIGVPDAVLIQGIIAVIIAAAFSPFLRRTQLKKKRAVHREEAKATAVEGLQ
jgi:MFS family permease